MGYFHPENSAYNLLAQLYEEYNLSEYFNNNNINYNTKDNKDTLEIILRGINNLKDITILYD